MNNISPEWLNKYNRANVKLSQNDDLFDKNNMISWIGVALTARHERLNKRLYKISRIRPRKQIIEMIDQMELKLSNDDLNNIFVE